MAYAKSLVVILFICTLPNTLSIQNDVLERNTNGPSDMKYRLPNNTVPMHYIIKLIPDIAGTFSFDGEISAEFKVLEPTASVALHLEDLELNGSATQLKLENGNILKPENHSYDNKTNIMVIHFGSTLEIGTYILRMIFRGILRDDMYGFYRCSYKDRQGNKVWMVATQFEPISARKAFPCWDEPALKASFDISIKHYTNYTALSNMPRREQSQVDDADGKVWSHFATTPIMSTYLVAFVVAAYENISNDDGTINAWSRKDLIPFLKFAHEITQKASAELERYTNSTVRVPKMDHVAVPKHSMSAMENWGLIIYPEKNIKYNENTATYRRKCEVATIVIHELTHQWFGNVVSPTWWSHVWLNEGFSSYFEYYIIDKIFQNTRAMDLLAVDVVHKSLFMDDKWDIMAIESDVRTTMDIELAFSRSVYTKAPAIVNMLANIISPEVFRAGLVKYLNEHEYGSATPDSLWAALQSTLNESDAPRSVFNVKEVMDTWIKQKRYPLITVECNYSTGEIKLTQKDIGLIGSQENVKDIEQFNKGERRNEWWVPINYATEINLDFSNTRPTHWIKPQENLTITEVNLDDWIIVNKQQSGYYRVNYDETNWRRIGNYLRSENFTKIHVLNRAQIINDAMWLMHIERLSPEIFLEIVGYLSQETDYIPWRPAFQFLRDMSLLLDSPFAGPIKTYVLNIMNKLIEKVGFEEHEDDEPLTILIRIDILKWACTFGHVECKEAATTKFMEFFNSSFEARISPNLKSWVFSNGMKLVNESIWNKMFEMYLNNQTVAALRFLSGSENPVLMRKYLNASISNDLGIPKKHQVAMIRYALDNLNHLDLVLDFVTEHWSEITERSKNILEEIYPIFYVSNTEEQVEKVKELCKAVDGEIKCSSMRIWEQKLRTIRAQDSIIQKWSKLL
ncbi:aminopeptidase N-like isoform X1 [Hylaeus volcanicus]|uniref:aminopeptidase N-like isoform X1 n=2 Tax=Hylaeus volcanicus TaxID=313075 RepID=UPI0023B85D01|nr:aminopeptidase N-like isoform X1 [Hylaeus volcanicus]XP_053976704.1 aminopeptidase N-like isoform X1 [Hylaeus volcanicus]XP_053976705.1 aminopeptidase N-like isoform X1 [Hylaeus volcanicus]XP_053976706.1 aminopeptidase N-like isoform X1 [Hylaeus volcanicus]XP_053976707.1 aminopeptidase N-like isoform X1 [Hylaeus volcanicus]XP_053976708.1 aminopeptidase N-like isoform X1 [Hylaeus volcanicus]XP_053976709.1 aminopeptidase N-like isoform X1 [Hylaeus volcanicus]